MRFVHATVDSSVKLFRSHTGSCPCQSSIEGWAHVPSHQGWMDRCSFNATVAVTYRSAIDPKEHSARGLDVITCATVEVPASMGQSLRLSIAKGLGLASGYAGERSRWTEPHWDSRRLGRRPCPQTRRSCRVRRRNPAPPAMRRARRVLRSLRPAAREYCPHS